MNISRRTWLSIGLWLSCSVCSADVASEHLQIKLQALHSMTAHFSQTVSQGKYGSRQATGSMALLRPGRFLWQTQWPTEQLLLADGRKLYIYDRDLEQVTIKPQAQHINGSAGIFLSVDKQLIARDFRVRELHKKNATCYALQAKSQQESLQAMQLCFVQEALTEIYLTDQLGQQTHIRFTHIKTNIALQQSLFKLTIPKGTDVVEQ